MTDIYSSKSIPNSLSYSYLISRSTNILSCFSLGRLLLVFLLSIFLSAISYAQPTGFVEEEVGAEWDAAVGLTFSQDGKTMYVWEKKGKVWIVENGEKLPIPLLDISDEVGNWGDHGLLGFALDPNFSANGYVYALYVVDRHHLFNFGKGSYNPSIDEYYEATIGRVTRYTATGNRKTVDPNSRKILIGATHDTGIPVLYESHGIGTLKFGEDGSLLVSTGDGATAGYLDVGYDPAKPNDTYVAQALKDGIINSKFDVGAFKSQQVQSLNGKILRIDPATGKGLPSNPFYNSSNPDAPESKVWALGLRNPFRFTVRPGTGNANFPGTLYIGDSGWQDWEEVNVATKAGMNFGWPIYEGLEQQVYYANTGVFNPFVPNPLFGKNGCDMEFIRFQFLLKQPKRTEAPYFNNPCDFNTEIGDDVPKFVHERPSIDWVNAVPENGLEPEPNARTGTFEGEQATTIKIGAPGSPVTGPQFYGSSSTGGVWYTGDDFPAEYKNTYFFGDYGAGWIRNANFDGEDKPKAVRNFINKDANVVAIETNPVTGGVYYINYATQIKRVTYYGSNTPPKAVAEADKTFGTSPLVVNFSSAKSTDAEGQALSFEWDFGDGTPKVTQANPTHTFTTSELGKVYTVKLKVTDSEGLSSTDQIQISVNNTPPIVKITSPAEGTKYPMEDKTVYNLRADVTDKEHSANQLTYEWQTVLHHNTHVHPEPIDNKKETTTTITPIGCDSETYFYRISLKVTDAGGLSSTDFVDLYPDCKGGIQAPVTIVEPTHNSYFDLGSPITFKVDFNDKNRGWAQVVYYQGLNRIGTSNQSPFDFTWNHSVEGSYSITAKAHDDAGHTLSSEPIVVNIGKPVQPNLTNCLPGVVHYFGLDEDNPGIYSDFATNTKATCTTCPTSVDGKFQKALKFGDGKTGLNIENVANFNWNKNADFTISFWMKSNSQSSTNSVLVGRNAANSRMHWWIGLNPQGQAMFMLRDVDHTGIYIGAKGPALNDGKWHKIVAVRDGSNTKSKLFVDGKLIDQADYFYTKGFEGMSPVNIGYMQLDHGYHFKGELDELKLYNRAILEDEVVATYNQGEGSYCGSAPLSIVDNENFKGTFEVFPNPNNGEMGIFVSELFPGESVRLILSDVTGKQLVIQEGVASSNGTFQYKLSTDHKVSTGLYNLLLTTPDRSISRKIVITK